MFRIKVNATSANLCVGFDVLGLALDIPNEFEFETADEFEFYGFEPEYCNVNNNMVYDSYVKYFEKINEKPVPVRIGFKGQIPVSRGLGSSSSLIVAGVFAANYVMKNRLNKDQCFAICAEIEGHPDNVAPAIYGNLVASYKEGNSFIPNLYNVSNDLKFITVIPPFKLSTHEAREVLPKELPYADIVHNLSRIVNVPRAFEVGNIFSLKHLFSDKLHEPYRGKLIKGYDEIKAICENEDVAFCISGSGSTMLIIAYNYDIIAKIQKFGYDIRTPKVGTGVIIEEA